VRVLFWENREQWVRVMMFQDRSVELVTAKYLNVRGKDGNMVSTSEAVRAIRAVLPNCSMADRELADVVAKAALKRGCAISFDIH
jgi:hypothetical protein